MHPYYAFLEAGMDVEFCSISGVATCDPSSIEASKEDAACMKFWNDEKLKGLTLVSKKLADCDISAYDSIFFAGGFGVMCASPIALRLHLPRVGGCFVSTCGRGASPLRRAGSSAPSFRLAGRRRWDFPKDPAVIAAIKTAYTAGKPVAAVCHGPICFINVEVCPRHAALTVRARDGPAALVLPA